MIAKPAALLAVLILPLAVAFGPQQPQNIVVYDQKVDLYTSPIGMTTEQRIEFHEARNKGLPLPDGFAFVESQGNVKAILTGHVLKNGTAQIVVTLSDESADLEESRLYINGVLKVTATAANGRIETHEDLNIATMSTFVGGLPITAELQWDSQDQTTLSRTFSASN